MTHACGTHLYLNMLQGAVSIRKTVLPGMAIPMLKIRRPTGRLIFNMGIPIPGKTVFYIETGPRYLTKHAYWQEQHLDLPLNLIGLLIAETQYIQPIYFPKYSSLSVNVGKINRNYTIIKLNNIWRVSHLCIMIYFQLKQNEYRKFVFIAFLFQVRF